MKLFKLTDKKRYSKEYYNEKYDFELIISLYEKSISSRQIGKKLNISAGTIIKVLKANDIKIKEDSDYDKRRYEVNDNYLDEINTQTKAYFLGLFAADGCNHENIGEISIKLQEYDEHILLQIKDNLEYTGRLYLNTRQGNVNNQKILRISSVKLSNRLSELGFPARKSLILKFPKFIPDHLVNHFIRGFFDGNGSIYKHKNKKEFTNFNIDLISSPMFCLECKEYLENKLGIHLSSFYVNKNKNMRISCGGNQQVKKLMDYLYKDATIYLYRKYDRYLDLCKMIDSGVYKCQTKL